MKFFLFIFILGFSFFLGSCQDEQIIDLEIVQATGSNLSGRDTVLRGHPLTLYLYVALPNTCTEFRSVGLRDTIHMNTVTIHAEGATAGGVCTQELRYYQVIRTLTLTDTGTYYLRSTYSTTTKYLDTILVR